MYSPGMELVVDAVAVLIVCMLSIAQEHCHAVQPCICTVTEDWDQTHTSLECTLQYLLFHGQHQRKFMSIPGHACRDVKNNSTTAP